MGISGNRVLYIDGDSSLHVLKALASDTRLLILSLLSHNPMNISELAETMGLPHSTVNFNLNQLQEAGLISVQYEPGSRGSQKLCAKKYDEIILKLPGANVEAETDTVTVSMPIGNYRNFDIKPTCGLASESKIIGMFDDPRSFFEPDHVYAQILWFGEGFVEYAFPNNLPYGSVAQSLVLSMEICSEAPQYDPDWPSDITLWLNDIEVGTWTCPGDFGGTRGRLTPAWWLEDQTMYGLLKHWQVTEEGSFIDGEKLSGVTLEDLHLGSKNHIKVKIGVKDDARHKGGVNLFGRKFGNYEQDLVMRMAYRFPQDRPRVKVR